MRTTERYYLTLDGRVVTEGHADAYSLLYPVGIEVPDDEARRAGLIAEEPKTFVKPPADRAIRPKAKEGS